VIEKDFIIADTMTGREIKYNNAETLKTKSKITTKTICIKFHDEK